MTRRRNRDSESLSGLLRHSWGLHQS